MNGTNRESQPFYPSVSSPLSKEASPFHRTMPGSLPSTSRYSSFSSPPPPPPPPPCDDRWGPPVMGNPAVPTCHPDNKKAAMWGATDDEAQNFHHPYLQYSPVEKSSSSRTESVLKVFNSWGSKAETTAQNIWQNLRTNSSVPGAAWGKMNLTAKALTGVAGTLYVSDAHAAFCSDRPLSFTAPSGQVAWSYYKVMIPLNKIGTINPVVMRENQSERYIQIVTIDGLDFWFTGFVNFEKASRHLSESISSFVGSIAAKPMVM
ncbi:GEM-LIKE PROTEIN 2 [Salix purpurea]|uniref:GEM-LIKE PROTEIN 2 n=1 Tax=Salix purpurea TaxID=77065 RepID=A0A9Q0VW03_SALPP|nr:GEM-LIKE PROTEIN 2 [Salix purpurea]